MKVAVLTTSLDSGSNDLWAAAGSLGIDVLLLGGGERPSSTFAPAGAIRLRSWDMRRDLIWRWYVGVSRALNKYSPDLVHVNGELWGLPAVRTAATRWPLVVHGAENLWHHGGQAERWIRHHLVGLMVRRACGYASWNTAGRNHIAGLSPAHFPLLVVPAIIPPDPYRTTRWGEGRKDIGDFEVLLVGRLVALKGFDTVIRAVAKLRRRADVVITICGTGSLAGDLQTLANRLDVRVRLLGNLPAGQLAVRMAQAHLLVQPSISTPDNVEQFGRAVAEAMTVGLPAFVSNSGELPAVVGFDRECIFPEGDADALSAMLEPLISQRFGTLTRIASRQSALARRYSPAIAGKMVVDFWSQAIEYERGRASSGLRRTKLTA